LTTCFRVWGSRRLQKPPLSYFTATFIALIILVSCTGSALTASGVKDPTPEQLGHKVLAVREAIRNPGGPDAMRAVIALGRDQRSYVMVRGWLSYQLEGDRSILDASDEQTPPEVRRRIRFLEQAIRAIDLE